jgi:hypothetical protein
MIRLGGLFRPNPERAAATERVKEMVRARMALGEAVTVSVNEIECGDPACPGGVETVILVRGRASVEAAMKIPGPVVDVTPEAVAAAIAAVGK